MAAIPSTPVSLGETIARAGRFIEAGAAFEQLDGAARTRGQQAPHEPAAPLGTAREPLDVIVIGGGQAGLSVGYHLKRAGLRHVILDAHPHIGETWRRRWDSLRLFTPARFCGLDGLPFPAPPNSFPTKDAMADYLQAYASHFDLPVRTGVRVDAVQRAADRYVVTARSTVFEAPHVVIAAASYQRPFTPPFAAQLDAAILQLHASAYRNPTQLRAGRVLLVGAGNSGAEIARELAATHEVMLAGRSPGELPFRTDTAFATRIVSPILFRVVFHRVLTVDSRIGRKAKPAFVERGAPLIRVQSRDLAAAGAARVPRVVDVRDGRPLLEDGRTLDVENVVWCTGYRHGLDWVKVPVFDERGRPRQYRGVIEGEAGLYVVGLAFLHSPSSAMIHGVGRDASRVVETIRARLSARRAA